MYQRLTRLSRFFARIHDQTSTLFNLNLLIYYIIPCEYSVSSSKSNKPTRLRKYSLRRAPICSSQPRILIVTLLFIRRARATTSNYTNEQLTCGYLEFATESRGGIHYGRHAAIWATEPLPHTSPLEDRVAGTRTPREGEYVCAPSMCLLSV